MMKDYDEKGTMMPWGETVTRRCILRLEGGAKVSVVLSMPKPNKALRPDEMERMLVEQFNRSQPHMEHKVVGIHMMRN